MRKRYLALALCALLIVSMVATSGCAQKKSRSFAPFTESSSTATSTATSTVPANSARTFHVVLTPLNDSGVSGDATVTVHGNSITVWIDAKGLEPDKKHEQHIHGFRDNKPSRLPAMNAMMDVMQAEQLMGPPLLALAPTPQADSNGVVHFKQTYTNVHAIFPLQIRGIMLHGMTKNGAYDFQLPVAAGLLRKGTARASGSMPTSSTMTSKTTGTPGMKKKGTTKVSPKSKSHKSTTRSPSTTDTE